MWLCSLKHLSLFRHTCGCVEAWKRGLSAWQSRGERTRLTTTSKRWNRSFALSCLWLLAGWGGRSFTTRLPDQRHKSFKATSSQPYLPSCFPNRPVPIHQPMWSETAKRREEGGTDQMVTKGTNEMRGPTHTHTHTYASVDTFNKCMPAFIVSVIMYTHLTGQIAPRWSQAAKHLMELRGPFQICN